MSDPIITDLGVLRAAGQGYPKQAKSTGSHTVTVSLLATGAIVYAGVLMGSNDNVNWSAVAALSATGTDSATATAAASMDYAFWRHDATTLTGAGVWCGATMNTDESSSFAGSPITHNNGVISPGPSADALASYLTGAGAGSVRSIFDGVQGIALLGDSFIEQATGDTYVLPITSVAVQAGAFSIAVPGQVPGTISAGHVARINTGVVHNIPVGQRIPITTTGFTPSNYNKSVNAWVDVDGTLVYDVGAGAGAVTVVGTATIWTGYQPTEGYVPSLTRMTYTTPTRCWVTHLINLAGGALRIVQNASVGGTSSIDFLQRISGILDGTAKIVFFPGTVNDIRGSVPTATTLANLDTAYKAVKKAGKLFITSTIPWTDVIVASSPAMRDLWSETNRQIRNYCRAYGIPCADFEAAYIDPTTSLGLSYGTWDTPSIHPSDWGGSQLGNAMWEVTQPHVRATRSQTTGGLALHTDNLINNGVFNELTTIADGVPDFWWAIDQNAGTPTRSIVSRGDFRQTKSARVVATASAQGARVRLQQFVKFGVVWAANKTYDQTSDGRRIRAAGNDYVQIGGVTTSTLDVTKSPGATGATEPSWNTQLGSVTIDGAVAWMRVRNFNPGDRCILRIEHALISASGGNGGVQPSVTVFLDTGTGKGVTLNLLQDASTRVPKYPADGIYRTWETEFTIPSDSALMQVLLSHYIDNGTTATSEWARCEITHAP